MKGATTLFDPHWVLVIVLLGGILAQMGEVLSYSVLPSGELHYASKHLLHVDEDSGSKEDKSKDNSDLESKSKLQSEDGPLLIKKIDKDNLGLTHGFIASLSVIIVSELGDKTFFIAAIMAMTHSRLTVLMGALAALFFMTFLSAMVGYATTVIPRALTYYVSSALFAIFGLKMLREGWYMTDDEGKEEYEEVQADLKRREDELHAQLLEEEEKVKGWYFHISAASEATFKFTMGSGRKIEKQNTPTQDVETGIIRSPGRRFVSGILSTVFLQSLTLTFLAEWGDRSQIATIILGARENVFGVILGAILGHTICTGLAVLGGRFIAQRISVRTVTLIGGVVFLLFALSAFWIGPGT